MNPVNQYWTLLASSQTDGTIIAVYQATSPAVPLAILQVGSLYFLLAINDRSEFVVQSGMPHVTSLEDATGAAEEFMAALYKPQA